MQTYQTPIKFEKRGNTVSDPNQYIIDNRQNYNAQFTPSSVPSSLLTASSTQLSIFLNSSQIKRPKHFYLQISVSETGGAASVTLCDVFHFVQRIELWLNGTICQTIYGDALYQMLAHLSPSELDYICQYANISSSTYVGPTAIPTSGSAVYYLPIFGCCLENIDFHLLKVVDSAVEFRCYFQNAVSAGTGVATVNSLILHCVDDVHTRSEMYLKSLMSNGSIYCRNFIDWNVQNSAAATYAGSNTYTQNLSAMRGPVVYFATFLRASVSNTSVGNISFLDLGTKSSTWSLLDSSGKIISGTTVIPLSLLKLDARNHFNNDFYKVLNNYVWSPCSGDAREALKGNVTGFSMQNNLNSISLQLDSTLSSGTATLTILGATVRKLCIKDGVFSVEDYVPK